MDVCQGMYKSVLAAMATTGEDGGTANANNTALAMYSLYFFEQPQLTSCFIALEMTGLVSRAAVIRGIPPAASPNVMDWG